MKAIVVAFLSTIMLSGAASAAEIKVIGSPGFREAYTDLLPGFEKSAGHHVATIWGGVNEVAKRAADGEVSRYGWARQRSTPPRVMGSGKH